MAPKYKLSDSESEAEADAPVTPSDEVLEKGLRDEVTSIFQSGKMEELTVKRVRLAVEKKLGLSEGFFKTTGDWKERSDRTIKEEAEAQENAEPAPAEKSPSPAPQPKQAAAPKRPKGEEKAAKPRKRQKTETPVSEDEEASGQSGDESDVQDSPLKRGAKASVKKSKPEPTKEESPAASDAQEADAAEAPPEATKDDSESEMSVVYDEEPEPQRKKQKTSEKPAKKEKKKPAPKAKGKDEDADPDQAEIKRLQGWLVKCGIRKMWWRELAPYETPKAKIKHLKQMLEDAGMKGRYSLEKARQIRDERELKDDLEQIQQGAKQWGTASGDEGSEAPPPRRAAARGRQALAFLDSEGEESD